MTDKKFTDEEIIKALEYCNVDNQDCDKCVLQKECESNPFHSAVAERALDLINRQKAEIEKLNEYIKRCKSGEEYWVKCLLDKPNEAYKEFAEEIKEEIENAYNNNSKVLSKHMSKYAECPNYEFIATVQGKMNTLCGLDDFIDDLLKKKGAEKT